MALKQRTKNLIQDLPYKEKRKLAKLLKTDVEGLQIALDNDSAIFNNPDVLIFLGTVLDRTIENMIINQENKELIQWN